MDIRKVNDTLSVSAQIGADDISHIAALGFKSIICNRPDGEDEDQTLFETIDAVARRAGLHTEYLPIAAVGPVAADIVKFKQRFEALPKPVLAYCKTGKRSLATWTAGQAPTT